MPATATAAVAAPSRVIILDSGYGLELGLGIFRNMRKLNSIVEVAYFSRHVMGQCLSRLPPAPQVPPPSFLCPACPLPFALTIYDSKLCHKMLMLLLLLPNIIQNMRLQMNSTNGRWGGGRGDKTS